MSTLFQDNFEVIKHKNIRQIKLLGSHDSSSYSIDENAHIVSDNSYITSINKIPKFFRRCLKINKLISTFARSQTLDIYAQLKTGIRVLDIRIVWYDNQFFTNHALLGIPMSEVLRQTDQFVAENTSEFVILKFIWSDTGNKSDYSSQLSQTLKAHQISQKFVPVSEINLDLQTLKVKNARIFVVMEGSDRSVGISNNIFANRYHETNNFTDKINNYNTQLQNYNQNENSMFDLQIILTPNSDNIKEAVFKARLSQNNLQNLHRNWPAHNDLTFHHKTFPNFSKVNTVAIDFVDESFTNLAAQLIKM